MIRARMFMATSLLAFATLAAACTTEQEADVAPPDDPSAPIATVALDNGNKVEFYEPSPGLLLVSELGKAGVAPLQTSTKDPVALYRELLPGKDVPPALLAAKRRSDELPPGVSPQITVEKAPEHSLAQAPSASFIDNVACDDSWFNTNFCGGTFDWKMCLLNHWNGAFVSSSSVDYVYHAVCADVGDVTLKVKMGNGGGGLWTVLAGQYRTYRWRDECVFGCNSSTRGDVLDATNNRFHYSVRINY